MRSAQEQWAALLQELRATYVVSEPAGRVRVSHSGRHQAPLSVELVMTPDEFSDLVAIPYGSLEPAIASVLRSLAETPPDTPYVVYHHYDLHPSPSPELPPDPGTERLRAWKAAHPGEYLTIRAYPSGDRRDDREGGPRNGPPSAAGAK